MGFAARETHRDRAMTETHHLSPPRRRDHPSDLQDGAEPDYRRKRKVRPVLNLCGAHAAALKGM